MSSVVAIWLLLSLLGVVALAGLALPGDVRRPRDVSAWLVRVSQQRRAEQARREAEAAESIRYAQEIAVAARGAATTAERRRADCQRAQAVVEKAWQAYQDAAAALDRARRAAAFACPAANRSESIDSDPIDRADREQALRRAASAAYRRGDLSGEQLLDALTQRNGWDAGLHPVDQEIALARAVVKHRFAAYSRALDAEDEAWRAADIATAAVHSLRREVTVAQAHAQAVAVRRLVLSAA